MKKAVIILLLIVVGVFFYIAALEYCDQREDFMLGICEITKFIP